MHDDVRHSAPLVHCLTNSVVQEITANVLLAAGAAPAMVSHPEEAGEFAAAADAVLINVGNPDPPVLEAMRSAVAQARRRNIPWVLDPVAVGGLGVRTRFAVELLDQKPTVIRGNASEVRNLHVAHEGSDAQGGRGVDSTDDPESALEAGRALAALTGGVVAISGPTDIIVSGGRVTRITGGDELMALVIGTGCSLGAVTAAYCVAAGNPYDGAAAAHVAFSGAGALAAKVSAGPGSFRNAWIDALYNGSNALPALCEIEEGE
ncbi:hydroxyethylthiazole kinase [Corynebacterium doosanense]|uniref:hydroxyethylthiazole kinase n=1 Tax=Corynebacterium doosanense TaxID=1121358 RepID=UPI0004763420|nr:hydroxyethylthiazole kinase [Corynebacterium doosanense]